MEILDLASMLFDIDDDGIKCKSGKFYFYTIIPPNTATMDEPEHDLYSTQLRNVMRSTTEQNFFICALDKTVALTQNRDHARGIDDRHDYIRDSLLADLDKMENAEGNTQRSYYYGIFCKQQIEAQRFEDVLRSMGVEFHIADRKELILIMRCFNLREFVDSDIMIDPNEPPLTYGKKGLVVSPIVKHLLPSALSFDNDLNMVVQPNFMRKAFVVRNLPQKIERSNRGFLKKMLQMSNTTVTLRISDMNAHDTKTLVNKQFNNSKAGLFKTQITSVIESEADANTTQQFYREAQEDSSGGGAMKYVNIFVETYGKDRLELDTNVRKVKTTCDAYGVTLEDFVFRQEEGYFGVSPLGYDTRGRTLANNIPSKTLGFLYPFSSSFINDATGMILGRTVDNGMVSLDVWVRTTFRTNSNIAIIGDSGMGKSYLQKKIIAFQHLYGATTWILDSENEYSDLVRHLGGKVINCSAGSFAINPLQVRTFKTADDEDANTDEAGTAFSEKLVFNQHLSWLKGFIRILLPSLGELQFAAFWKIVRDVYNKFDISENTDFSSLTNEQYPLFSDVYSYIDDVVAHPDKYPFYHMINPDDLRAVMLLMDDLCVGSLAPQFNRYTNAADSSLVCLNIQGLLEGDQGNMLATLFNYITYIWGKVTERRNRLMLVIDELYLLANEDNPVVLKYCNSFERRSRKYDASLVIGTQKVMDCLNPKISQWTSALFDTPTYKFLFFPGEVDLEVVKNKLHLSAGELVSISLPERKNCLLKVGKDKYHIKVGTLPYEAALFGKGGGN